ncbi:MAG: zinc-binding alcohol dehydrogenase family protein [Cutibacterium granulosum]|uniref:zinc-binding alcohol dehydrogenase family protein n=1 Tax=Cutibacterium granulosum TaxID=33011 RepID=UPI002B23B70D|nr:zinc-binding alcohol dehydrogenase family protein [Cutibacterium granulosum]MEA5645244.1 zinc-binding alcohol dehydrogenase family protein [Cutibacterium granulosum]
MDAMHAVAVTQSLPITDPDVFVDVDLPVPSPGPLDLLVEIEAISLNPIDVKLRRKAGIPDEPLVLGFDAAGVVRAVGERVSDFQVGDVVWFSGQSNRPGSYAQYTLVDSRIAARRPTSLSAAEAAAMPLTSITAWEGLHDHLRIGAHDSLLMIGGAGGVGSMVIQLARLATDGDVVATSSREASRAWCRDMGATAVIDHRNDLAQELHEVGVNGVETVFSAYTVGREAELAQLMSPFGRLVMIDGTDSFDMTAFKPKSLSVTSESMFARPIFGTDDVAEQGRILARVADLVDEGRLRTTVAHQLQGLTVDNIVEGTALVESGRMVGKIVVTA